MVSGDGELKAALEHASDISEQTKATAAVLGIFYALLPIKRFEISGALEPALLSGAAATLILESEGHFVAATTLQGPPPTSEKPDAAEYMWLADPAAVWIQYQVARAIVNDDIEPTQAESQALVREGLDCFGRGELEAARARYWLALQLDQRNWAAYVALAVAEARLGEHFPDSISRIEEGLELMREGSSSV